MPLGRGSRLGPYDVTAPLGAGGMGEVYRARDTRLQRDVALKLLPERFLAQPERRARFELEARALAALNHPNIGGIYGLEDSTVPPALVLELVEGETLAERIARGRLPVREALTVARQIAVALEAAHGRDIIHRDLKPANIKITPEGVVKVLDFGLAKLSERADTDRHIELAALPTITSPAMLTTAGMVIGTAAYVSPEQARGRPADRRADIWAFGCVLFEMLTGRRAFDGDEVSDTIAFVLTKEPDWSALPADTPPVIATLLRRCLRKDPSRRLADIADARIEIEEAIDAPAPLVAVPARATAPARWLWAAAALAAGMLLGVASARTVLSPDAEPPSFPFQVSALFNADAALATQLEGASRVALSRDARMLAVAAVPQEGAAQQMFIRAGDQKPLLPLRGTENSAAPFFDPSGQWLGFFQLSQGIAKMAVTGGAIVPLAPTTGLPGGGAWTEDGRIVFQPDATGGPLHQVAADGRGPVTPLTTLADGEVSHLFPDVLPGDRAVIFTAVRDNRASLTLQPLPSGEPRVLEIGATYGRYAAGHVLFVRDEALFALPLDLDALAPAGSPFPIQDRVASGSFSYGAQFSASHTNILAYIESRDGGGAAGNVLQRVTQGVVTALRPGRLRWGTPRFSPDGGKLALTLEDRPGDDNIWVLDVSTDTLTPVAQYPGNDGMPIWTPEGRGIVFGSTQHGGPFNLYWQRADGVGKALQLTNAPRPQLPRSMRRLPNGEVWLTYHEGAPPRQNSMFVRVEGDDQNGWAVVGEPLVLPGGEFRNVFPTLSPDGRWVAYLSDKSGILQLYVRRFPALDNERPVSNGLANDPVWSETSSELLYSTISFAIGATAQIYRVAYDGTGDEFVFTRPTLWSEQRIVAPPIQPRYGGALDRHPDGWFVAAAPAELTEAPAPRTTIEFVFNLRDLLRTRRPAP